MDGDRPLVARALGVDLRSLAALRVGLGGMLLYDLATRALDLTAHYTDLGALPRAHLPPPSFGTTALSLHAAAGSRAAQAALFLLAAAAALALLVGWRTRLAAAASWFLLQSLHARNPLVCYEADLLLALLLLWSLLLPLGARWSLDARRGGLPHAGAEATCSLASAGLLLQVCAVYWFAALEKTGPTWADGTAVAYALSVDQYSTPLGRALLAAPAPLLAGLTWGTLLLEVLAPLLLLLPWTRPRLAGVGLWAALQAGFFLTMDLGIFPAVGLLALVPFLPGRVWDRLGWIVPGEGTGVLGARAPVQAAAAGLLALSLLWNLAVLGGRQAPGWLAAVCRPLHLDQSWAMFAPDPMTDDGWFVVPARLADGSSVDLLGPGGGPQRWDKPPDVSGSFGGDRWKEYLMTLRERPRHEGHWERYLAWRARDWDARHPGRRVVWLAVAYLREETLPPGTAAAAPRLEPLGSHRPGRAGGR